MASKKEVTHEALIEAIVIAENALGKAKDDYKDFCKENPLTLKPQMTNHELRMLRLKNDKATLEDHQKANKAAQSTAQKEQLKQELKG